VLKKGKLFLLVLTILLLHGFLSFINVSASYTVKSASKSVTTVIVTSVGLNKSKYNITVGQTYTLLAIVNPLKSKIKTMKWKSSNPGIVKVDSKGKVTAVSTGTAKITVTTVNGNETASCIITVAPLKIISIDNISVTLKHNENYKLPKLVKVKMSNGVTKLIPVSWDRVVDTSKIGISIYSGSVKGFNNKMKLTLNIIPNIISISNMNITINTNSHFKLPTNIDAILRNNTLSKVNVKWNSNTIDTTHSGTHVFYGTVQGFNGSIVLTVNITNIYSNINDVNATVNHNEKYSLPQTVTATITNAVTTAATIKWDITYGINLVELNVNH